jgi:hypothetical protein
MWRYQPQLVHRFGEADSSQYSTLLATLLAAQNFAGGFDGGRGAIEMITVSFRFGVGQKRIVPQTRKIRQARVLPSWTRQTAWLVVMSSRGDSWAPVVETNEYTSICDESYSHSPRRHA